MGSISRLDQLSGRMEREAHRLKKAIVIGAVGLTIYLVLPSLDPPNAFLAMIGNVLPVISAASIVTTAGAGAMAGGSGMHLWRLKTAENAEKTKKAKESKILATKFVPLDLLQEVKTMQREVKAEFDGIQLQLADSHTLEDKVAQLQTSLSRIEMELSTFRTKARAPMVLHAPVAEVPVALGGDVTDLTPAAPKVEEIVPTLMGGLEKFK